jgi:hypothetical protein
MIGLPISCASPDEPRFSQADADALSEQCGAPNGWIIVHEDGDIQFEPPLNADYDVSACLLNGIEDAGVTKIGFVGNEKYPESEEQ